MKKIKQLFVVLVSLGLLASLCLNWSRHQVEQANRSMETVMDYQALVRMADSEGLSRQSVFKKFKDAGVTTLAVSDRTIMDMAGEGLVTYYTGGELLRQKEIGGLSPSWQAIVSSPDFTYQAVYLADGTSRRTFDALIETLGARFDRDRFQKVSDTPRVYMLKAPTALNKNPFSQDQLGIQETPLILVPDELLAAKENGFMVAIRPNNFVKTTKDEEKAQQQLAVFFKEIDETGADVSLIIGSGRSMLGEPRYLKNVANALKKRHITLGMVEADVQLQFIKMDGLVPLSEVMDYDAARVYTIAEDEQRKMKVFDAFRRWSLADDERNIRVNYIRPFVTGLNGNTALETNLEYVSDVTRDVASHGYISGRAGVFAPYHSSRLFYVPMAFSVVAAWRLYFLLLGIVPQRHYGKLVLLGGLVLSAGYFTGSHALLFRQVTALLSAIIFPVLSMARMITLWDRRKGERTMKGLLAMTTVQLGYAVILSLIGASLLGAVLGDTRFLLEIDIYRGVKVTFMMPVLLTFLLFVKRHGLWNEGERLTAPLSRIRAFLNRPFTLSTLIVLLAFAIVAWVFIGRSGHTAGVPVPAFEEKLRYFLEETMYARPREKEFLIGHPAFYLTAWCVLRKLPTWAYGLFAVAATIGQASLVQTFCHMRTPIFMSYVRALDGYALGVILGVLAVVVFEGLYRAYGGYKKGRDARG